MNPSKTSLLALALTLLAAVPRAGAVALSDAEKKACQENWPGQNKVDCAKWILTSVEAGGMLPGDEKDKKVQASLPLMEYVAGKQFPAGWNAGAAFAMPGGVRMKTPALNMLDWDRIFINDSFFDLAKDSSSAACVIAHEMSHLQLNHIKTRYALLDLKKVQAWLKTKEGRPYMPKDAKEIMAGYQQYVIGPATRDQEKEADIRAFKLLDNYMSSFNRRGCIDLMDELKKSETPGFVDPTHPSAQERIEYLAKLDKETAPVDRGPAVKVREDDPETQKALDEMNKQYEASEAARKKALKNICPQVGVDDKGNPVTKCL